MYELALVLATEGKNAEAEPLFREALILRKKLFDDNHVVVADSLDSLATVLSNQRKYAEAEAFRREAIAMRKRLLGPGHPSVADSLESLARLLNNEGRNAEAEDMYREALAIARQSATNSPAQFENRLYDSANRLYRQQQYAAAEPLYRELLLSLRARHSATNENVLGISASLARLLSDWAWAERPAESEIRNPKPEIVTRAREAEGLLRDCLAIRMGSTNANHWRVGDLKSRLGGAFVSVAATDFALSAEARQSKLAEAEHLLLEGNERLQQSRSADHKSKRDALERLVRLYEAWDTAAPNSGKFEQAEEWKRKLASLPPPDTSGASKGAELK